MLLENNLLLYLSRSSCLINIAVLYIQLKRGIQFSLVISYIPSDISLLNITCLYQVLNFYLEVKLDTRVTPDIRSVFISGIQPDIQFRLPDIRTEKQRV